MHNPNQKLKLMKKSLFTKTLLVATISVGVLASCTKQNDLLPEAIPQSKSASAQQSKLATSYTITFEGISSSYKANNTSYGDNAYSSWTGTQIAPYVHSPSNLKFAIKGAGGGTPVDYWNGGFVVSDWNYKSNIPGKTGDWWYSYLNQCCLFRYAWY